MKSVFTKLRYIGDEERLERGPWAWTIVEIETGHEMQREAPTRKEAELQLKGALFQFGFV